MSCSPVLSNYMINKVLGILTNQGTWTPPTTVYLALYTSNPNPNNSGTEVTGGSYARQAVSWTALAGGTSTQNSSTITFPTATANWGAITYVALLDAASSGNLLMFAPATVTITINNGQTYTITSGNLVASLQ